MNQYQSRDHFRAAARRAARRCERENIEQRTAANAHAPARRYRLISAAADSAIRRVVPFLSANGSDNATRSVVPVRPDRTGSAVSPPPIGARGVPRAPAYQRLSRAAAQTVSRAARRGGGLGRHTVSFQVSAPVHCCCAVRYCRCVGRVQRPLLTRHPAQTEERAVSSVVVVRTVVVGILASLVRGQRLSVATAGNRNGNRNNNRLARAVRSPFVPRPLRSAVRDLCVVCLWSCGVLSRARVRVLLPDARFRFRPESETTSFFPTAASGVGTRRSHRTRVFAMTSWSLADE